MIPYRDENPSPETPYMTYMLIAANVIVFLWQIAGGPERFQYLIYEYGYIPAVFLENPSANFYRLFTSMFMHGGWLHLIGNMLYLYIFGDNVEAAYGKVQYLIFYLLSGMAADLLHTLMFPTSMVPAVGASGAISGVLGAYLVFYPEANIMTLVFIYFYAVVERIPAKYYIGFWFLWQLIPALIGESTGVAYWAHIGGFIAGVVMSLPLKDKVRMYRRERYPEYWWWGYTW